MADIQRRVRELLEAAEPHVDESSHRCHICRTITYDKFRANSIADELFNKRTFMIGSFEYLRKSAFAGCFLCRLLFRCICQTQTHTILIEALYSIQKVGLRLSLDDELTLHCWTDAGQVGLWNDGPDVIEIKDSNPACSVDESSGDELRNLALEDTKSSAGDSSDSESAGSDSPMFNPNPQSGVDDRVLLPIWLGACTSRHPDCSSYKEAEPPILPTRILDVGTESSSSHLIIADGMRSPYVTLSHCWGKTLPKMVLTHDRMESMMSGVDDDDMPATFLHAIKITRVLNQRYLWIDSMCIIQPVQGDKVDWEREGPRMAEYYGNSLLNIAASAASDSTEGCFHGKAGSQFGVVPFPLFQTPVHRTWNEFDQIMGRNSEWLPIMQPKPASWLHFVQDSPLSSRAWVLQERLLAPRTLHCTMQGFFWECSALRASEYEPVGCRFDYGYRDQGLSNVIQILKESNDVVIGSYWRSIVERFTQLSISVGSDRLPALAGLAKILQSHTKDTYIAGHWKGLLISSLLWFRLKSDEEAKGEIMKEQSPHFDAPSWSWASLPGQVKFTSLETTDYPTRDPEDYSFSAKLLHLSAEPASENPFAWVTTSRLKVLGRLRVYRTSEGLLDIRPQVLTSSQHWRGYLPMSEPIGQFGAIQMQSSKVFEEQITHKASGPSSPIEPEINCGRDISEEAIGSEPLKNSITTSPQLSANISSSNAMATAAIVANNDLLQAQIRATMENITQSDKWKELDKDYKRKEAKEAQLPKGIDVIFDSHPLSDGDPRDEFFLLQLLFDKRKKIHEGLVLMQASDGKGYKRVGFFKSKDELGFDGIEEAEVELI